MRRYQILGPLFILSIVCCLQIGCQQEAGPQRPPIPRPHEENNANTMEVTIGGKVWEINPNLSYIAIGVWTNPNPRPLTAAEKARLNELNAQIQAVNAQIQDFETQRDELDKELRYLERMDRSQVKVHFNFGKPPHLSNGKLIHLGEFPMELEEPSQIQTTPTE